MVKPITAKTTTQGITRRDFLVRSTVIAGSGFFSIGMPALLSGKNAEAAMATPAFTPAIWFTITPDGKTTMHIVKAEMGQHIGTGLAQVIAEELEVRWEDVRLDAPLESVENFGVYGLAYTVNSGSVTTEFDRIARAGAAGRIALVEAGAKVLSAKLTDCHAEAGRVVDKASGRSVGYGEILQKVKIDRKFSYPDDLKGITLKDPSQYKIIGKSFAALDIPAKTNGKAKYGIDVFLPNMAYGALVVPRSRYASEVLSIDDSEEKKGANWVLEGDVDKGFGDAEKVMEVEYTTDMVCHATRDPLNAKVQLTNGEWHVNVGTQSTSFARMTLTG